jgi:hypothetical protein
MWIRLIEERSEKGFLNRDGWIVQTSQGEIERVHPTLQESFPNHFTRVILSLQRRHMSDMVNPLEEIIKIEC